MLIGRGDEPLPLPSCGVRVDCVHAADLFHGCIVDGCGARLRAGFIAAVVTRPSWSIASARLAFGEVCVPPFSTSTILCLVGG